MAIYSVSIRELRPKLPEVVADVSENMTRYIITKRGKPTAVILDVNDYNALLETLNLQSDEVLMQGISQSQADFKKGRGKRLESIKKEF